MRRRSPFLCASPFVALACCRAAWTRTYCTIIRRLKSFCDHVIGTEEEGTSEIEAVSANILETRNSIVATLSSVRCVFKYRIQFILRSSSHSTTIKFNEFSVRANGERHVMLRFCSRIGLTASRATQPICLIRLLLLTIDMSDSHCTRLRRTFNSIASMPFGHWFLSNCDLYVGKLLKSMVRRRRCLSYRNWIVETNRVTSKWECVILITCTASKISVTFPCLAWLINIVSCTWFSINWDERWRRAASAAINWKWIDERRIERWATDRQ